MKLISFFLFTICFFSGFLRSSILRFLLVFLLVYSPVAIYSQPSTSPKIDSLKVSLKTTTGKSKADLLIELAREYRIMDIDSLLEYSRQATILSKSLNYPKGYANGNLFMGLGYHNMGKVQEARGYYFQALHLFEKLDDKKGVANAHNSLGNSYMEYGDFKTAVIYHSKALLLREQIGDKKALTHSYNNIGNAYAGQANYYLALNNHLKGLKIKEELKDTSESGLGDLATSYLNIGRLYLAIEDCTRSMEYLQKAQTLFRKLDSKYGEMLVLSVKSGLHDLQKDYDKSIEASLRAIEISTEACEVSGELADNYMRVGYAYYKRAMQADTTSNKTLKNKDYEIAFNYAKRSLEISEKINYELCIISGYLLLGNVYSQMGEYDKSQESFDKTLKYDIIPSTKIAIYEGLYLLKLTQKDYKGALENYTLYTRLKDSVYNTQNTLKSLSLGASYEEEKKEKIRQLEDKNVELAHEEEIKRQRIIQLFILIGLFLVVVFAAFVYRSYRQKRKANILITQQKGEVEKAYLIIEEQKKLVDEHNKDITDSINYARRIQTALLASESLLNKNLPEYFVLYKPKDIVSGDFYWASEIKEDNSKKFVLCTGDCTGHGVPGAFMSLLNISKLNETINEKRITRPDIILNNVREEIIRALNPENAKEECNDGMDCTICTFEFSRTDNSIVGTLHYSAANNPFYLVRDRQLTVSKADKIPVGKSSREDVPFALQTLELQKGDTIYMLTDGYADQFGGQNGKKFKYKQLEDILLSFHDKKMNIQKEILNTTIEQWRGSNEQVDDILIIGIRV